MSEPNHDVGGFEKSERQVGLMRRLMPRSLFGRSLLILITPVILIQVITTLFFIDRHWTKISQRLSNAVAGEIAIIAQSYEDGISDERVEKVVASAKEYLSLDIAFRDDITLKDLGRTQIKSPLQGVFIKKLHKELDGQLKRPYVVLVEFENKLVTVEVQLKNGVLQVQLPERRLYSSSGYIFLLWVFGSSVLLLIIAIIFMRNQVRPIRKLAAAAKRLGQGRDVPSFKPEGAREVRDASQAFIDMHRRIKRQVSQRTTMLAGVSHDLRTPLTRLKLQLAMLGDTPDIVEMKNDISDMEKMINGYLDFVRDEGGEQTAITHLNVIFERVFKGVSHHNIVINKDIKDELNAMIRPNAFERALANIVQNAAKYAGEIWVSAHINDERKLVICVDDNGPGIPHEKLEDVFKPFYRLDEARNLDSAGVGLGLPIAMDVVHAHGGKIWLEHSPHGGLRVMIRMPV